MSEASVRESRARIVAATHRGRRAIERQLHDGPQQHLVAMAVKLRLVEQAIDESPESAKRMLDELRTDVQEAVGQLRDLAFVIYPPLLSDRGLGEALRAAAARSPHASSVDVDVDGRYPPEVEAAVYFACLDAMRDAPVEVSVAASGDGLVVDVRGEIEPAVLTTIADHVETVGGMVRVEGAGLHAAIPASVS